MNDKKKKSNKISIYLIKEDVETDDLIKEELNARKKVLYQNETCVTYYIESYLNRPNWLKSYFNIENDELIQSNAKVISFHKLNIDNKNVIFAIPFGNGKSLLKEDMIEDQFGLKVLLNSVDIKSFRQIQTIDCGKNFKSSSEQLPKIGSLDEFVFDIKSDLMRKAVAKCEDDEFCGNMITGGDVISVTVPYDINDIDDFLIFCYKRYKEKKYLENFSWIDNIKEVKSKNEKEILNEKLIEKINNKEFEFAWMAVPENISWENVKNFKFYKKDIGWDDIEIQEFIKKFPNEKINNFEEIKNRSVYAFSNDDEEIYSWPAHKCIMAEIQIDDRAYCYNGGKWYKINKDFSVEIEQYYETIPLFEKEFPLCENMLEKEYNEYLCHQLSDSYLMDCNLVETGGIGHSDIELCDVLTKDKELIHIKRGESSSYLSHLFNQARVSSDFMQDEEFRMKANDKIGINYFCHPFNTYDYTVVLAIITKKESERPKIPFFSKVTIKYAIQDLIRKGYKVKIKNIISK